VNVCPSEISGADLDEHPLEGVRRRWGILGGRHGAVLGQGAVGADVERKQDLGEGNLEGGGATGSDPLPAAPPHEPDARHRTLSAW
jgi:hypothetical protein